MLSDDALWSSAHGPGLAHGRPDRPGSVLVSCDPPLHTAQRKVVSAYFRPAAVKALEPAVREIAARVVGGAAPRGRADLTADIALPVSLTVMADQLGLSPDSNDELASWVLTLAEGVTYQQGSLDPRVFPAYRDFSRFFSAHITARTRLLDRGGRAPHDLLTTLITSAPGGRRPVLAEVLGFCQFLLVAGSVTTAMLIGNVVRRLLEAPDQLRLLRDGDRGLLGAAVEESLRFDAPLHGLFRTSTQPVELHGVPIPAGAKLLVLFGAANRDPSVWADPDTFDISRDPGSLRRHLAFGHGIHFCLGAQLARLEAAVTLALLLDDLPGLRLTGPAEPVAAEVLNGFARIPIAWTLKGH